MQRTVTALLLSLAVSSGTLEAQSDRSASQPAELVSAMRALKLAQQTGKDPAECIREIGEKRDAKSLVLLSWAYGRTGDHAAARGIIGQLHRRFPDAGWTKQFDPAQFRPTLQSTQDRPKAVSNYLQKLVMALDGDKKERGEAYRELSQLGALAVPAILKRLPKFTPVGMRQGLELVLPHIDESVLAVIRKMIESKDPIVQMVAASAVPNLRGPSRVELGRIALACKSEQAKLSGVQALLASGAEIEVCVRTLGELRRSNSSTVRERAFELLGEDRFRGKQQVDTWFEEVLGNDPDSELGSTALTLWLNRRGKDEGVRRFEMYTKLGGMRAEAVIQAELRRPIRDRNQDLLIEGLRRPRLAPMVMSSLRTDVLLGDVKRLSQLLLEVSHETRYGGLPPLIYLLRILENEPKRGVEGALKELINTPNPQIKEMAFRVLAAIDPVWILDNHERFISDSSFRRGLRDTAERHARPQDMAWITAHSNVNASKVFGARSDGTNLGIALDLAAVPALVPEAREQNGIDKDDVRAALARWFGADHVTPTMERLLDIESSIANQILVQAAKKATKRDVPAIFGALKEAIRREEVIRDERGWSRFPPDHARRSLIHLLGRVGGAGYEHLESLVEDPKLGVMALQTLREADGYDRTKLYARVLDKLKPAYFKTAEVADRKPTSVIEIVLRDPLTVSSSAVRRKAVHCLRTWPREFAVATDILERLPAAESRATATVIIERIGTEDEVGAWLTGAALRALGRSRDEKLIALIAKGLESRDPNVRDDAVSALGRTLSKAAAPHLIRALGDEAEQVRLTADHALSTIADILEKKKLFEARFEKLK